MQPVGLVTERIKLWDRVSLCLFVLCLFIHSLFSGLPTNGRAVESVSVKQVDVLSDGPELNP